MPLSEYMKSRLALINAGRLLAARKTYNIPKVSEKRKAKIEAEKAAGVKPGKRKGVKKFSPKRKEENLEYQTESRVFLVENPNCQIQASECTGKAVEVHHTYSGKDRAKYFLDKGTWKAVCRKCHNWVHKNPKQARELKLLK